MRDTSRVSDEPIINSMLDIDFYKFSMGRLIHELHPNVPVTLSFKNRTKDVRLLKHVDINELREQLEFVRKYVKFGNTDLHYLRGTNEYRERMFPEPYLQFLKNMSLPEFDLRNIGGELFLVFYGKWSEVTYWETIALSIINELYYRSIMNGLSQFERQVHYSQGILNLHEKIKKINEYAKAIFSEFGTRRRFFREWQDRVVEILKAEIPAQLFRGTSNVFLANKYELEPMGTNAHEMQMVYSGIYYDLDDAKGYLHSQEKFLEDWEATYGLDLSIALPDTFGSDYFFQQTFIPMGKMATWKGTRWDSGDPFQYGDARINEYKSIGVDPTTKVILFSDGLDVDRIIEICNYFNGRIKTTFGWGTNLTNDLGFKPLSLVVKVTQANGHPVCKLSDNISKATGEVSAIQRMKKLTCYTTEFNQPCRY
jgi:nicotinate phosphoribosyltransferase